MKQIILKAIAPKWKKEQMKIWYFQQKYQTYIYSIYCWIGWTIFVVFFKDRRDYEFISKQNSRMNSQHIFLLTRQIRIELRMTHLLTHPLHSPKNGKSSSNKFTHNWFKKNSFEINGKLFDFFWKHSKYLSTNPIVYYYYSC